MSHFRRLNRHFGVLEVLVALGLAPAALVLAQPREDAEPQLHPAAAQLLADPSLPESERRDLAIFHGQWDGLEGLDPAQRAALALARYELDDPSLSDPGVPALLRAKAAVARGEPEAAVTLLEGNETAQAALVRAEALEQLGRTQEAMAVLAPWRDRLQGEPIDDAAELTAAAEALVTLARFEGRPTQDYKLAMSLLGRARNELDRFYWPASLAEARLLNEKDNGEQAAAALADALRWNPRSSQAWFLLGQIALDTYNFDRAGVAIERLRAINADHLLASMLEAQMALTQKDPATARDALRAPLRRHPEHRELLALAAATEALSFDEAALAAALERFEALAPGHPLALFTVGRYLSQARQYQAGERYLRQALELRPKWPEPRIELGLLLMQAGEEDEAREELAQATQLDPFNLRAKNQHKLLEELRRYAVVETEHFIVKYRPGIDEVLARDMPERLEQIYADITDVFSHKPARKTLIEIMEDEQHFAVRITGMPWIWTIGASTGDVIAITPPREGPRQRGTYDWERVIRHEFVHTVTLDQTANRVPHWFTEACAVSQEPGGRDYHTCELLAAALQGDKLFTLDQINWAFIRPKAPHERPLAYAQSHWMLEYLTERYGHEAVVKLLTLYRRGFGDEPAFAEVTGESPADFLAAFKEWAREQVRQWGLLDQPLDAEAQRVLAAGSPDPAAVAALLERHPDHPEVLRAAAALALAGPDPEAARQAVLRYANVRPLDPWPHRALVRLALQTGRPQEAIGSLEQLDGQEQQTGAWARQLAEVYRASGRLDAAMAAAERAITREPYNASYRELAATIALQRGQLDRATHQVESMAILEPDRATHQVRLAALYSRAGREEDARRAAAKALELDPAAPVPKAVRE